MPIYVYVCPQCGYETEITMTIVDYTTVENVLCSQCLQLDKDSSMQRVFTPTAFRFEGGKPSSRRD